MKRIFPVFLAAISLLSCQKNDEQLPVIERFEIDGGFDPATASLMRGESLAFRIGAKNAASYEWYVNGEPAGTGSVFIFTPAVRGTYTITGTALNKNNGAESKSVVIKVVDPAPSVTSLTCNGTAFEDAVSADIGGELKLAIVETDVEIAAYAWSVDGEPIDGADASEYTFAPEWSGDYRFAVELTNLDGITAVESFTVAVNGPFEGYLLLVKESDYGMNYGEIDAIDHSGVRTADRFNAVNGSRMSVSVNDAAAYGSTLYCLTTASDFVYEIDAQTLRLKRKLSWGSVIRSGTVRRIIAVGKEKAYVSTCGNSDSGTIVPIDLREGKAAGSVSVPGMFTGRLAAIEGKVLFGGNNLFQYIDTATDEVKTIKTFDEGRTIRGVSAACDGKVYVLVSAVSGNADTRPQAVCFDASTLAMESTADLDVTGTIGDLCASSSPSALYFTAVGTGWGAAAKIYRYDPAARTARLFADPGKAPYGCMNISADGGELYFAWGNGYSSDGFYVYSTADGSRRDYAGIRSAPCIAIKL